MMLCFPFLNENVIPVHTGKLGQSITNQAPQTIMKLPIEYVCNVSFWKPNKQDELKYLLWQNQLVKEYSYVFYKWEDTAL